MSAISPLNLRNSRGNRAVTSSRTTGTGGRLYASRRGVKNFHRFKLAQHEEEKASAGTRFLINGAERE